MRCSSCNIRHLAALKSIETFFTYIHTEKLYTYIEYKSHRNILFNTISKNVCIYNMCVYTCVQKVTSKSYIFRFAYTQNVILNVFAPLHPRSIYVPYTTSLYIYY